ncbi:rRNA maturation RNase YbeY [Candidatus Mycoplasma mahonii]|uniref:rRNA maturation RNase YbeY n=1 Tax=Candidatus Mycoplasma mahonii TaxID=3004105 RepID=UPI0026F36177|nr:rRNA maturation RNase YbeY [Candidatus Mycoplasma mahonii]WKX02786.1 rRNA maturation RNase YbeY [Candidatus Mycoplasma mahonii]
MNKVYIENEHKISFSYKRLYKKILNEILTYLKIEGQSEVNVIIVDNKSIKAISKKYKHIDKPTDVLSFSAGFKKLKHQIHYNMFGDIFISYEKVFEQSKTYNHSQKREWCYLFSHGLLHLIGYDHVTKKNEEEMNQIVDIIMKKIKVERYV